MAVVTAGERMDGDRYHVDRVRYHRLYFQLGFIVSAHADLYGATGVRPANLGVTLMFYTAHMRVIVESLAELTGVRLEPIVLPESPVGAADRSFDIALDDLRTEIVPRVTDKHAEVKAKSLARLVKYWRARDRHGAAFDAAESAAVSAALGMRCAGVDEARRALAVAIVEGRVGFEQALHLCHARMARDTALMADAMGAFASVYFVPLEDAA